ncbi:GLPGLI family protein [Elizabethkingia argentiflava]|uniref:GLPGLI family protein n=1 Tax=Elizabethkingia argenteiflava TaxID=2681556 RepID=A0A845PTS2_9FLAO|nr:GLPGLI family protein [Elizabethkingia argenteiflava]NAW51214.1 GLPGLI family protein [Elizabethkingia argenteiflava]
MKWKKLYKSVLFFILFIYGFCDAQNYRVNYQMSYKRDSLDKESVKKNMLLLIKNNKSKFYAQDQFISDSIALTGQKTERYNYDFMVVKDNQTGKIYRYTYLLRDLYRSSDEMPVFKWNISEETKKIGDYLCQKQASIIPIECGKLGSQ